MLRSYPHGEDPGGVAGGDTSDGLRPMGRIVDFNSPGTPPGEDGAPDRFPETEGSDNALIDAATREGTYPEGEPIDEGEEEIDFLGLLKHAQQQALLYMNQVNRRSWSQSYRAFHNQHYIGSKYTRPEYRNRSKIFRPKTRSSVRKDLAAVAASLFTTRDAIRCTAGNEADPRQRGAAALMQALVNYRTSRMAKKASLPWFQVAMGARQDAVLTGLCLSKQYWLNELEYVRSERVEGEDGASVERKVYRPIVDRPDVFLFPPENFVIDPAADWRSPVQSAAYVILKYPMRWEEIEKKQNAPRNPWNKLSREELLGNQESGKWDMAAIRRARELGLDRFDETQTGTEFEIIWVYETFMRVAGTDWTFFSAGDRYYLTEPRPVEEVYPEQAGERPLAMGYGSFEAHRLFPMGPVESWQELQIELNDMVNLTLDAVKQNVMPISKVRRGRAIDMDQVKRRSSGSSIIVTDPTDVTWERPPDVPQSVPVLTRELELEFDDLAGQFNGSTAENNNALSRTLGGLKLVSGAANALQEFDIAVWVITWAEPVVAQLCHLEQYYESDPVVLGLAGDRAQLFQKHGISKIDDDLLDQEVTMAVSAGMGQGDPQQRLQRFAMAIQMAAPIISQSPEFQSGKREVNVDAVIDEIFGNAGYADGGARFFRQGQGKPNPLGDLPAQELASKIEKNKAQSKAAVMTGLAAMARVALGSKVAENEMANNLVDAHLRALEMGHSHGHRHNESHLSALDHGMRHGLELSQHAHDVRHQDREHALAVQEADREHMHRTADREAQREAAAARPAAGE